MRFCGAMQKLPRETVLAELAALGVPAAACDAMTEALALRSLDELEALLGPDAEACRDLRELWTLAEGAPRRHARARIAPLTCRNPAGYGFADWLVFDATVVRGLAYYTGVVFEAFDRSASLRCAPLAEHVAAASQPRDGAAPR
jgi:histidyl-tRNA synthetase